VGQVRKESSDSLEYVCPECGETFDEGAEDCASCGLEFDWSEEMEYLCPECGTMVDPDQARCPGCGAQFSMHDDGDITIEYEPEAPRATDQDLLEAAIDESIIRPNGTIIRSEDMEEDVRDRGMADPSEVASEPDTMEMEASDVTEDEPEIDVDLTVAYPRLYPGGFTLMGMVFTVLALLAFGFSIVVARYDTWIQGAAEESMGDNQMMLFVASLSTFAIFMIIAAIDLLRSPKGKPSS
jgi:DNA-directed RNA polymerase subunit RPC12/RpoP